jgi:phage terminase large subunit-like protein
MPYSEFYGKPWVRFFEQILTHTKGQYAREKFLLNLDWQKRIIMDIFGTVRSNGLRQYTTAYVEVPKKNGKTELAAGIALGGLVLDGEPGAEVYLAASTREQASICFRVAAGMVRNSEYLNSVCRIVDSTKTILLKDDPNSFLKAISADAGNQDGINPSMAVFDELHRQKTRDLWDVLAYGMAIRRQPLLFAITTAGIIGESPICEQQHEYAMQVRNGIIHDPSYYPVIYQLDQEENWMEIGEPAQGDKPATGWYKANPSLGHFLGIDKVKEEFERAMSNPAQQNSFRRLRLCQWVGQETRYLPMEDWAACGEPFNIDDFAGKPCFAGLDLSSTQDITAFVMVFEHNDLFYWIAHFWLPEFELQKRARRDRVPYDIWAAQGLIHTTPGNQVDYQYVRQTIRDLAKIYDIREVGYDRWNATQIVQQLTDDGMNMIPIGQGYQSMSAPTKELLRHVMSHRMRHGDNPILRWMADCLAVKQDTADGVKPAKADRRRTSKRIDGIVAGVNAIARLIVATPEEGITYTGLRSVSNGA